VSFKDGVPKALVLRMGNNGLPADEALRILAAVLRPTSEQGGSRRALYRALYRSLPEEFASIALPAQRVARLLPLARTVPYFVATLHREPWQTVAGRRANRPYWRKINTIADRRTPS
jgi:hypothetical protein